MGEKRDFLNDWWKDSPRQETILSPELTVFLMDFQTSTMTFMKNSKRFLLWEIWASMRQWKLLRI